MNLFTDELRREPFAIYRQMRAVAPLFKAPPPMDAWLVFDYPTVKWILNDHAAFSSAVPAPKHWFIFADPPAHTKLRALVAKAFTPRVVNDLEPEVRRLSSELLDAATTGNEMDLARDYGVPLPMKVIAGMIGIPTEDWSRFRSWSDSILKLSYARSGGAEADEARGEFMLVTAEMNEYLTEMIAKRRAKPKSDLLTRLIEAEVDGEKLSQPEILGFFQLLVVGGQDTTANLVNNAIVCLLANPDQLESLRAKPELLPSAIEETLRYRSPIQWLMRTPRAEVEIHGQKIAPKSLILAMVGSANHDEKVFPNAEKFDIARQPNPHIAFGHGIHSCIGAALARMEARIALEDLFARFEDFELAEADPWPPRRALHVHGPESLRIRFEKKKTPP